MEMWENGEQGQKPACGKTSWLIPQWTEESLPITYKYVSVFMQTISAGYCLSALPPSLISETCYVL